MRATPGDLSTREAWNVIFGVLSGIVGPDRAGDLAHDAYETAHRKGVCTIPYVLKVAFRRIPRMRTRERRVDELSPHLEGHEPDPFEILELQRRYEKLNRALAALPKKEREILERMYWDEEDQRTIADKMAISYDAARQTATRARKRLRRRLGSLFVVLLMGGGAVMRLTVVNREGHPASSDEAFEATATSFPMNQPAISSERRSPGEHENPPVVDLADGDDASEYEGRPDIAPPQDVDESITSTLSVTEQDAVWRAEGASTPPPVCPLVGDGMVGDGTTTPRSMSIVVGGGWGGSSGGATLGIQPSGGRRGEYGRGHHVSTTTLPSPPRPPRPPRPPIVSTTTSPPSLGCMSATECDSDDIKWLRRWCLTVDGEDSPLLSFCDLIDEAVTVCVYDLDACVDRLSDALIVIDDMCGEDDESDCTREDEAELIGRRLTRLIDARSQDVTETRLLEE